MEEIGVRLGALNPLGKAYSCPGISMEALTLFLAPFQRWTGWRRAEGGGRTDENEEIEVVEMALDELTTLADAEDLKDMKTIVLLSRLRLERPDLLLGRRRPAFAQQP